MMKNLLVAAAALASGASATAVPWKNCGPSSGAVGQVTAVTASPYPLVAGENSTISFDVSVADDVASGTYQTTISYEGINLYSGHGSVCALNKGGCPINKGALVLSSSEAISSSAPAGTYDIKFAAENGAGASVFCATMTMKVVDAAAGGASLDGGFAAPDDDEPINNEAFIDYINSAAKTWTAGESTRWTGLTFRHARMMCGALEEPAEVKLPLREPHVVAPGSVPDSFDSREQWGSVCPSVKDIRDQASCGSCWAVSAAETQTDRTCIASNGTVSPYLSGADILSCCSFFCGSGCDGGFPSAAQSYWVSTGVVTGGPYGSNQGCFDYPIPMCEHHVSGPLPPCTEGGSTPACNKTCADGATWAASKHFGKTSYSVSSDVEQIQTEIMTHGPVQGTFTVYADFPTYKSGVYQHTTGAALGGHAIKIIGWGVEDGTPYWLVANSWNTGWGNAGFFKILRGSDECGIESGIAAGLPKL